MKKVYLSLVILLVLLCTEGLKAQAQLPVEDEYQMKSYIMVFLTSGPNRTHDSATAAKIQQGHLDNIGRLFDQKKLVLAGPFLDRGTYRGIFILDVATADEAIVLLATDPAIQAGRLSYELHPWYGPGNIRILKKSEAE